ncbi:hypothetical protein SK128_022878, partial [Halocaridina rubra]
FRDYSRAGKTCPDLTYWSHRPYQYGYYPDPTYGQTEVALDIEKKPPTCPGLNAAVDRKKVICSKTAKKGGLCGDSGGPLVVKICKTKWVQLGVFSLTGSLDEQNIIINICTRVPAYKPWIDGVTGLDP